MHTHSPAMALSQQPMIPPLGHPTLTMPPQYMMSSPGSMPLTPQIPQAAGVPQASKFSRKSLPMTMQLRHDIPPSVHVAAATGQPILAPAAISTPPQLTMPYSSQGMIPTGGPPQPGISYAQVISFCLCYVEIKA
ncbi:uncharacterized protein LOC106477807, partial [Limulus polyphemus]|uniref:Uncharacterized protein LOC106477807 n=1 Tax=Limulus polyphemus TaxID=6850 RepID=A0ABM1C428_LIMPO